MKFFKFNAKFKKVKTYYLLLMRIQYNMIKMVFLIIASIIGAGFASGKEIYEFFTRFGSSVYYFYPLIFILFFYLFYNIMIFGKSINDKKTNNFTISNNKHKSFINYIFFITFLILSSAMYSGLFTVLSNIIENAFILILILSLISFLFINMDINSITKLSFVLAPIITMFFIINCILNFNNNLLFNNGNLFLSLFNPSLYVFQNVFLSMFVIIKASKNLTNKQILVSSLLSSMILIILIVIGSLTLAKNSSVVTFELPFLVLAHRLGKHFYYCFYIVLLFAILTTYISLLSTIKDFSLIEKSKLLQNKKAKYLNNTLLIVLISLLGFFKLSNIVKYLYPIIGVIGFIYCVRICKLNYSQYQCKFD